MQGVLAYAQSPEHGGLWMMDTPAPAVESITALAARGCQLILFTTGVDNTIGSAIAPTVKITGNEWTAQRQSVNIGVDIGQVLSADVSIAAAVERIPQQSARHYIRHDDSERSAIAGRDRR